jgi:ABC-type lipoprotein export system ATPase subunit
MATRTSTNSPNSTNNHDPFQQRQGKTLVWRNVNMRVKDKGKQILNNVWGRASNETTAILGPSGSGKTSLLNILAGRITTRTANLTVESDITLDGVGVDPTSMQIRRQIAYVAQDDALHISSTPREAIHFSAKLRLPKAATTEELTSLTNTMLSELGLSECADTIVGGALLKGISGGERKRTSVAVELVTKPTLVFLDEPTSGKQVTCTVLLCHAVSEVFDPLLYTVFRTELIALPCCTLHCYCRSRQLQCLAIDNCLAKGCCRWC